MTLEEIARAEWPGFESLDNDVKDFILANISTFIEHMRYYPASKIEELARKNIEMIEEYAKKAEKLDGIRSGDYVRIGGKESAPRRVAYAGDGFIQVSSGGTFHLNDDGTTSAGGSLEPPVDIGECCLSDEKILGHVWAWLNNMPGARRALFYDVPIRVWVC